MSRLAGRTDELRTISELFERGERLVSIVGPAGIGKTRLANAVVAEDAAVVVDLAAAVGIDGADHVDAVLTLTAQALGLSLASGDRQANSGRVLRAILAREEDVFVLHTVEHVLGAAAELVSTWLARTSTARFLLTTREALRIPGEWVLELEPLDMTASVELLSDCARRAGATAQLDPEALADIARRLDRLPLALELAGQRIAILGETVVRERLDRPLDLLAGGRSRTLREAIDWSFQLLDAEEQRALIECSVFHGGFTLAAAEAVLSGASTSACLESLRSKSLVHASTDGGAVRFRLLHAIRDFARERLVDVAALHERHDAYYVKLAAELGREIRFGRFGDGDKLVRLEHEREHLVGILQRAREPSRILSVVFALAPVVLARGPVEPLLETLEGLFAKGDVGDASMVEAQTLRARLIRRVGRSTESEGIFRELLDRVPAKARPAIWGELGFTALSRGDAAAALGCYETARSLRAGADAENGDFDLVRIAFSHREMGDLDLAEVRGTEALSLARRLRSILGEAAALSVLGVIACDRGHLDRGRELTTEALGLCRATRSQFFVGIGLLTSGLARLTAGETEAADALFVESRKSLGLGGIPRLDAIALLYGGVARFEQGALRDAWSLVDEAHATFAMLGDVGYRDLALACLAAIEATDGALAAARQRLVTLDASQPPRLREAIAIHRLHVLLAEARSAHRGGDGGRALALVTQVRAALDSTAGIEHSHDELLARRLLEKALATVTRVEPRVMIGLSPEHTTLRLGSEEVDLRRRATAQTILAELARSHRSAPGTPVAWSTLAAAAWPGEKMLETSGKNRVRVTIAWLRKAGLRDVLASDDRGYWPTEEATLT